MSSKIGIMKRQREKTASWTSFTLFALKKLTLPQKQKEANIKLTHWHCGTRTPCHPILSNCYPITFIIYFLQIPNDLIIPSHIRPTTWASPLVFLEETCVFPSPIRATFPAHISLPELRVLIRSAFP